MAGVDTWDDVIERIAVHLRRAGHELRRPVTDVRLGEPAGINAPMIAYWYGGDEEGRLIGNTLSRASYTEHVTIRWYWPVSDRSPVLTAEAERETRRANRATTRAFWGDERLGGACAGLAFIEPTVTGWLEAGGWVRTLTLTLGIEMPDLDDIEVPT